MRVRPLALCLVVLGAALGAAGCSSSAAPGASSSSKAPVGKPGGTVTVKSGGKVVCVITLDRNGTGTCKVSTAQYAPGKVTYTGTYNSVGNFKSGASASTTLTITPAAKKTS